MTKKLKGSILGLVLLLFLCTSTYGDTPKDKILTGGKSSLDYYDNSASKDGIEEFEKVVDEIEALSSYDSDIIKYKDWIYYEKSGKAKSPLNKHIFRIKEDGSEDTNLQAVGSIIKVENDWIYFFVQQLDPYSDISNFQKMKLDGSEKTPIVSGEEIYALFKPKNDPAQGILLAESKEYQYILMDGGVHKVKGDESTYIAYPLKTLHRFIENTLVVDEHLLIKQSNDLIDIDLTTDEIRTVDYPGRKFGIGDKNYVLGLDGEKYFYFTSRNIDWSSSISFFTLKDTTVKTLPFLSNYLFEYDGWIYFTEESTDDENLYRTRAGSSKKEKILDGPYRIIEERDGWLYLRNLTSNGKASFSRCKPDGSQFSTIISDYSTLYFIDDWIYYSDSHKYYRIYLDGSNKKAMDVNMLDPIVYKDYVIFSTDYDQNPSTNYIMNIDGSNMKELGFGKYNIHKFEDDYVYFYDSMDHYDFAPEQSQPEDDFFNGYIYKYNLKDRKYQFKKLVDYSPPEYLFDTAVGTYNFLMKNPSFTVKTLDNLSIYINSGTEDDLTSCMDKNTDPGTRYVLPVDFYRKKGSPQLSDADYLRLIYYLEDHIQDHFAQKGIDEIPLFIIQEDGLGDDDVHFRFIIYYEIPNLSDE